jgi:hypothetical protein
LPTRKADDGGGLSPGKPSGLRQFIRRKRIQSRGAAKRPKSTPFSVMGMMALF